MLRLLLFLEELDHAAWAFWVQELPQGPTLGLENLPLNDLFVFVNQLAVDLVFDTSALIVDTILAHFGHFFEQLLVLTLQAVFIVFLKVLIGDLWLDS